MARLVSLAAREAGQAVASAEVEVVLIRFTSPDWEDVLRLSADPTLRLSTDPLVYGTRSRWQSAPGGPPEEYLYAPLSVLLPDEDDELPPAASLVLDLVDYRLVEPARAIIRREVRVDLALVLASTPDLVEIEYRRLSLLAAEGDTARLTLSVGLEDDDDQPHCRLRMTRQLAPSLWR